jgi:hypothetical protein
MSQFFGSEEMSVGQARRLGKSVVTLPAESRWPGGWTTSNPFTAPAKGVYGATPRQTAPNSLPWNILSISPLSTRFCGSKKIYGLSKWRRINNLPFSKNKNQRANDRMGAANSLFWNILPVSLLFVGFCGHQRGSVECKCFRINILTI